VKNEYDVVVVGGGAAGLGGALTLTRARRSVLVIDEGTPRNARAEHVHNYLTRDGVPPAELYAVGRSEVTGYGGEVITGTVIAISQDSSSQGASGFLVQVADGGSYRARRLLVTTGLADGLPDLPGLAERFGRDVVHCPYCHGWEIRDKAIGVLATGAMAIHQAMLFRQWSADVTLFLNDGPEPTEEQWEELAARGISVVQGKVAAVEVEDDRLSGIRLEGGRVIPSQALAVQTQLKARAAFLEDLGLKPVELELNGVVFGTALQADATGATEVPGVWVAGNVADPRAQVITSAAAGLAAAVAVNTDLIAEETRLAVAARSG
jgi:thioredoxin reductase